MADGTVAVKQLAEFCHRRGDIDYRFTPSPSGEQGISGHQEIYRRRDDSYLPEYGIEAEVECEGLTLAVRGRADGYDPVAGLIEEIKTCRIDPREIPDSVERVHWAQAKLYAALLLRSEPAPQTLSVQLTWFNIDTGEEYSRSQSVGRDELEVFLQETVQVYGRWLGQLRELQTRRDVSLDSLKFPFGGFRAGQRDLAETVYRCIASEGQLLAQAPTGIGKTAAVLYPALKALAANKHDHVSYITARTVGRRAAQETLDLFEAAGAAVRWLSLTAKDAICFSPGKACHGEDCPYAQGYYDRLHDARGAALALTRLDRDAIEQLARGHSICPYQLAADLIPWVDVTIADIHYVFSYYAALSASYGNDAGRWSLLLDEAHNLPGRARSMYSAQLSKRALMAARKVAPSGVRKALDRCNSVCLELQKLDWAEAEFHSSADIPAALLQAMQGLQGAVADWQAQEAVGLQRWPELLDFYFSVVQCLRVAEEWADDYRFEMYRSSHPQSLRLVFACQDGSRQLAQRYRLMHSITAFSATVSPPHWTLAELGFDGSAVYRELPSPFRPEQLPVDLNISIDTRYRSRRDSLPELAGAILDWLNANPGNCIVYFPAYAYMDDTLVLLRDKLAPRKVMIQEREQGQGTREAMLDALHNERDLVAFCILGGVFGEGVDLPGDALRSVIVVGVGLPQFNRQSRTLSEYYEAKYGRGYEFAYLYPGMQKVNQALGRVIRTDSDTGSALLIDGRYAELQYRELLPAGWHYREIS